VNGTFNGVPLHRITSVVTQSVGKRTLTTFRVFEFPLPDLENNLRNNAPAFMILSDKEITGRILRHSTDRRHWYEFTIESRAIS
jgi:hypothetical protein